MGISYSFNRAQATKLVNVSNKFDGINSSVKNLVNNMDSFFKGAAANACKEALMRRQNEINNFKNEASRIARLINQAVADIKREEDEEKRRNSGGNGGCHVSSIGPGVC